MTALWVAARAAKNELATSSRLSAMTLPLLTVTTGSISQLTGSGALISISGAALCYDLRGRQSVFSISVETRAGVTRHHLDSASSALAIVEDIQKETNLPIIITDRAAGRVLTIEELRRLANLERTRANRT